MVAGDVVRNTCVCSVPGTTWKEGVHCTGKVKHQIVYLCNNFFTSFHHSSSVLGLPVL